MVGAGSGKRNQTQPRDREARLRARAQRQWGVVTWWQLMEDGFSRAAINRRVTQGRLVRRHRGVYVVGHVPLTPEGVGLAAALAVGGDAVLGELSGAVHMDLLRFAGPQVDVTTSTRGRRAAIDGVALHRTRCLPQTDRTVHRGVLVAAVPRLLLDLAARSDISDRAGRRVDAVTARAVREHPAEVVAVAVAGLRARGWDG